MAKLVNNWHNFLQQLEKQLLAQKELTQEQAVTLTNIPDEFVAKLSLLADKVRQLFHQNKVDLCAIINARSGRCTEDCKFCAQASRYQTNVPTYPMKPAAEIVAAAQQAEANGAQRFCIVTSGQALNEEEFQTALTAIKMIKKKTKLKRCASLGQLSKKRALQLKEAGLNRYHHNIETAPSFFSQICTTHSFDTKLETIKHLKTASIETCVGGIVNLGETPVQRVEMAFTLKKINPVSVPINFLNPRPGTPLANRPPVSALEAVKYLAIFRLILPQAYIRLAGGRLETFKNSQDLPFKAGANALLIGNLLTTKGRATQQDLTMLQKLGFNIPSA